MMLGLGALWGSAFLAMKTAVDPSLSSTPLAPLQVSLLRLAIAAVILNIVVRSLGQRYPQERRTWAWITAIGVTGFALPFTALSYATQTLPSGTTALLMACVPLLSLLLGHFLSTLEPITPARLLGVLIGFSGVVLVVADQTLAVGMERLPALGLGLLSALGYASTGFMMARIPGVAALPLTAGALSVGALVLVPLTAVSTALTTQLPDPQVWGSVLYLGLLPTAFAFVLRFWLARRAGFAFTSQVGYLVPCFGLLYGWALNDETLRLALLLALALILGGILISNRAPQKGRP